MSVTWGTGAGVDHQLGGGKTARGVGAGVGLGVGRGAGELLNVFSPATLKPQQHQLCETPSPFRGAIRNAVDVFTLSIRVRV